jgi:transcriptional regulator with XRE-family HTH domain
LCLRYLSYPIFSFTSTNTAIIIRPVKSGGRRRSVKANLTEEVAERVKRRRTLLGLTQKELGVKAGLSELSVWMVENNKRERIRALTMRKLAGALETTVAELYGAEGELSDPLGEDPLQSPEGRSWSEERADWEHYLPPGAWIRSVADAGLDGLGEKDRRLFEERGRGRGELKTLRREIENAGPRSGHPDRRAWARDLEEALWSDLKARNRIRTHTLQAVRDALVDQELERLPEPKIFEIFEGVNAG